MNQGIGGLLRGWIIWKVYWGLFFYMEVLLKYLFCGNFIEVLILWKFYWSIYFWRFYWFYREVYADLESYSGKKFNPLQSFFNQLRTVFQLTSTVFQSTSNRFSINFKPFFNQLHVFQ